MGTTIEINPFTATSSGGDVTGPASSTDNAVARFDGATGKVLQNSVVIVDDSGNTTGVAALTATTSVTTPIAQGSTASGGNLTLKSTTHATKGLIAFGTSAYDEVNNRLGVGNAAPGYTVDVTAGAGCGINVTTADFVPFLGCNMSGPSNLWFENYRGAKLDISNGSSFIQIWDDASTVACQVLARHTRHLYLGVDGTSASKSVVVIGAGGQTGDLLQIQLSDATVKFAVDITGRVSMPISARVGSAGTPTTSCALDVNTTTGALMVPRMTTTQKNALTAANGMIVYDTSLNKFHGYENGAWVAFV